MAASVPADAAEAFAQYDRNSSGAIEVDELKALLRDLGLLQGKGPDEAHAFVAQQFALADRKSRDNKLDEAEFAAYFAKVTAPKLVDSLAAEAPQELAQLRRVFGAYATFGATRASAGGDSELDGARWIKLCKETKLIGRGLTPTDCDLMFAKVKERSARKITFEQFLDALDLVAAKKGQPLAAVVGQVAGTEGPALHGTTKTESVRFHDDTSTYTGVYARRASQDTFVAFASFGHGSSPQPGKATAEMESKQFIKLCRDARLIDRRLTQTACDLAFTKVKTMGARKISFKQFRKALELLAAEKGIAKEDLFAQVAACAGPTLNCITTPEAVDPESGRLVACGSVSPSAAAALGGSSLATAPFGSGSSSGGWGSEKEGRPTSAGSGSVKSVGAEEEQEEATGAGAELASGAQQAQQAERELQADVAKLSLSGTPGNNKVVAINASTLSAEL
ncbi:hypothetical protein COHA_002830 [Chlorella ohadii]|uniref:EF-hand domain-containing protein n=1 Tax=Chlorella ohadii TaxID=2649997 RepID=A0AAD5H7B1_9CHLO|nr:hypothetical protein COHA_002830 [Chlorella ohadii]